MLIQKIATFTVFFQLSTLNTFLTLKLIWKCTVKTNKKISLILHTGKYHFENTGQCLIIVQSLVVFYFLVRFIHKENKISPSGKNLHRKQTCMFSPQVNLLGQEAL